MKSEQQQFETLYDWLLGSQFNEDLRSRLEKVLSGEEKPASILDQYPKLFLFANSNLDREIAKSLCTIFLDIARQGIFINGRYFPATPHLSKDQFLQLFSLSEKHNPEVINLVADAMFCVDLGNNNNWNLIINNIPYAKYIRNVINKYNQHLPDNQKLSDRKLFDFALDNKIFTSPNVFLQGRLCILLSDIKNPPKALTIKSPIEDHALNVYRYLKFKSENSMDGYDSEEEDDDGHEGLEVITENSDEEMMQGFHDITHLNSVSFLIPVLINFYARHGDERAKKLKAEDIKWMQIAGLFHDLARRGEGEDWWDHDSGLALYYYLHLVLKAPHDKAKELAEAVANKDAESLGFYRRLENENGQLRWRKTLEIPALTIEREILHGADSLEVQRARENFNASVYLFLNQLRIMKRREMNWRN